MPEQISQRELVEILKFYSEAGVDCAVDEGATNWLAHGEEPPGAELRAELRQVLAGQSASSTGAGSATAPVRQPLTGIANTRSGSQPGHPAPSQSGSPAQRPSRQPPPAPGANRAGETAPGAAEARKLAAKAKSLDDLRQALDSFDGCALKATAKNLCFYRGAPQSRLMIIGEAPGRDEDLEGKPFVGRAGKLLDQMLAAIGLNEESVHITNVVYWRPPGNRTPTLQETESCRPFLERQVQFVEPEFVLLLGGAAAKSVLDVTDGIMRLRGKWRDITIGGRTLKALPTLHPAYLLRTPAAKRQAWRDLLTLHKALAR